MPVPKRKVSKRRRDQRSANKGIKPKAITACLTCNAPIMPHQICGECGYYKGAKIINTKADRVHKRGEALRLKSEKTKGLESKGVAP